MELAKKRSSKGGSRIPSNPIALVFVIVSFSCLLLVVTTSVLRLPDISTSSNTVKALRIIRKAASSDEDSQLGKFGNIIVGMLPTDLAFTVFVPSEKAIRRDLRLSASHNLSSAADHDDGNVYAMLSRVLSFSAVPRKIYSSSVPSSGKEISVDSVSGFRLFISKESDPDPGVLVVNRVKSERVDLREGEIVVHLMDGVIMDAEFEQSVRPDDDDDEG